MHKFLVFLGCALPMCAQTGNVVGAGYQAPAPVSAAPGQILTLLLDTPSLTGITVTLHQGTDQAVPVREVRSVSMCPGIVTIQVVGQPQCPSLAAVTVQIPYELMTVCPPCARPADLAASLIVSVNGATGTVISLNPVSDQVHILTVCDIAMQPAGSTPQANTSVLPCLPMVTHANGTLVSPSTPAKIGEELVAWAVGLGQTNPPAVTGKPAAAAAAAAQTFGLDLNYRVNAGPTRPFNNTRPVPAPVYAGLAQGFVGLYQINFVVPAEPVNGTPNCVLPFVAGGNLPQSNLTVSIGGQSSFDGAGICVSTQIPVD